MKLVTLIYESIQAENMRFLVALPLLRFILPEWSGWNKQREVSAGHIVIIIINNNNMMV